jgi:N-acetylglucosamine kinase-like BadF-type ATPase
MLRPAAADARTGPALGPGLGLDAGGTQTRWAVWRGDALLAEGVAPGLSALQLASADGCAQITQVLRGLAAAACAATAPDQPADWTGAVAGITGFGDESRAAMQSLLCASLALPPPAVRLYSDIELACRASFAPGAGCVLIAGTGAIAAVLAADGSLQRAGGRGGVIDDAGSGHWIAREALRLVWRAEDAMPGAWQGSPLARRLFAVIGGSDWPATRQWVYGATRGELGALALAVAAAAAEDGDAQALALLQQAGRELARLPLALQRRLGSLPIALTGRVFDLHPSIEATLRAELPAGSTVQRLTPHAHHCAARLAAGHAP